MNIRLMSEEIYEKEMLSLINLSRKEHGLKPLEYSRDISLIAQSHSEDMMGKSFVSHNSSDGRTTGDRILACNSLQIIAYGENVARDSTVKSAHRELMLSKGHRMNILSDDYTHIGIGIRKSRDGIFYITEKFVKLPVITDFSAMKSYILSETYLKANIEYEKTLETIARDMARDFIINGLPPKITSIPGYRRISLISYKGTGIEETIDSIMEEARHYQRFGFFAEFSKKPGKLAALYCILIFANK